MRYYDEYPPYVPVAQRRAKAEKQLQQMQKKHPHLKPVILSGASLAGTWWGKSWNSNLERYADYSNRIGRGRSYVRNRAVLDLQITSGNVMALVQGSRPQPYKIAITIGALSAWQLEQYSPGLRRPFGFAERTAGWKISASLERSLFRKRRRALSLASRHPF